MSSEEARKIVTDGLERKKADREAAQREAELDSYEQEMMDAISVKAMAAKENERRQQNRAIIRSMQDARRQEQARKEAAAEEAVKKYGYLCLMIFLMATWTPMPWYGAAALVAGLAVFPAVYIFRLYNPL